MSMSCQSIGNQIGGGPRKPGRLGGADWLSLAAAPTFAVMALLTAVGGSGPLDLLCSARSESSMLTGMIPMYLLMSAFHAGPWLKLRRNRSDLSASSANRACSDAWQAGGHARVERDPHRSSS